MSRIIRFSLEGGAPRWGLLDVGDLVQPLARCPFEEVMLEGQAIELSRVRLHAPVTPSKVIGVGSNYRKHIHEMGRSVPSVPRIFLMPPSAVIGPGEAIEIPPGTQQVDHEAELGVVIGRRMSRVESSRTMDHVAGFTCVNDVTARDLQRADGVFSRAKGFDSFCPVGPWIETDLDSADLRVRGWVDDELRQDGRTSDLIFDIPALLEFISSIMTLLPGDLISTGTPAGVGPLKPGQRVVVHVEGIGRLENPVVNRKDRQ